MIRVKRKAGCERVKTQEPATRNLYETCNECERTDVKPPGRHTCDLRCGITVGSEKDQRDAFDVMERTENTHSEN